MFVKVHRRCDNGEILFKCSAFLCAEQVMNSRSCDHLFTKLYLSDGNGYILYEICETPERVTDLVSCCDSIYFGIKA